MRHHDFEEPNVVPTPSFMEGIEDQVDPKDKILLRQSAYIGGLEASGRHLERNAFEAHERERRALEKVQRLESKIEALEEEYGDDVNRQEETIWYT